MTSLASTTSAVSSGACRLVILVSGRGSNMQAIVRALQSRGLAAQVVAVVSDKPTAAGLEWARQQGLETYALESGAYLNREAYDQALAQAVQAYSPDYVLLAGFMRILSDGFVNQFSGRLVNIHPSLLPSFPGLKTHEKALETGVQWHGCTVHFVTPELDSGPIIGQAAVPVLATDTPQSLAERVLLAEHRLYADVVEWLVAGRVSLLADGRVAVADLSTRACVLASEDDHAAAVTLFKA